MRFKKIHCLYNKNNFYYHLICTKKKPGGYIWAFFALWHFNTNFYNPKYLKLKAKSEMLSRHLKFFSWTLSFPENLFKNSMAFYVQNLEKNFDDLMSSIKKEKIQLTEFLRLAYTTVYYLPYGCFHDKTHQHRRCRWKKKGSKYVLIENEDKM